jgi:hypothetical protein
MYLCTFFLVYLFFLDLKVSLFFFFFVYHRIPFPHFLTHHSLFGMCFALKQKPPNRVSLDSVAILYNVSSFNTRPLRQVLRIGQQVGKARNSAWCRWYFLVFSSLMTFFYVQDEFIFSNKNYYTTTFFSSPGFF